MACININHPEYKKLLTELEKEGLTNQVNIQGTIHQYQEATGTDMFPPIDYLLAKLLGKTWEVKVANENEFSKISNSSKNSVKKGIADVFESNPELANTVYEALGFQTELPFVESQYTLDDNFIINDELIVTKKLQDMNVNNWDGSINTELDKIRNEIRKLPVGSKFNVSKYTNPINITLEELISTINLSESNKALLEKIRPLIKNTKIQYVDKFILKNAGAVYSDKYNAIRINKSEKNIPLEEILMHELLHAATFRKITYFETNTKGLSEKELLALNELENIRKVLQEEGKKWYDKPRRVRDINFLDGYATESIHEIISYAFTNKGFRDAISEIPYKGNKSILDKLVELIANIFGVKQDTVLNALLANAEVLLEDSRYEIKGHSTGKLPKGISIGDQNIFKTNIESIDDFVNNIKATFSKITDKDVAHKTYLKIGIKVHPDKGVYPTEYFQKLQDEYDEWKRINLGVNESETFEDIWEKMSSEEKAVWIDMELEMQKLKKKQAEAQAAKNKQDTRRNNELTERIRLENISTGILTGSWESLDKETMLWGIETGRIKLSHFIAKHENPIIQSLYSIIERDVWDKIPIKLNNEPNPKHRGSVATDAIGQIYDITIYTNGVFNSSTDQFSGNIFANVVAHETIHKFTLALLYGDMRYLTKLGFKEESILKSRKELDDIYKIAKDTYTGNFSSIKYALSNMAEFVAGFVDKPAFVGLLHYASNYVETTERIPITTEYDKNFVEALLDRIHEWIVRLFNPNFKINPKKTKTIYESQTVTKEEPLYNRYVKAVEDLFSLQNQVGPDSQLQTTNLLGYTGDITNRFTKLYGDENNLNSNFNQYFPDYSYLTDEEKEVFLRGVESGDLSINCTI